MISKTYRTLHHCDFDTPYFNDAHPIHTACALHDIQHVGHLLSEGGDVNAPGPVGRTPIFYTVGDKHQFNCEMFDYLISQGADIHAKDCMGRSLLHEAGLRANIPAAQRLLDLGMDVDIRDPIGQTPLIESCATSDPDMIQPWIEWGADVNAKCFMGIAPLGAALANENPGAVWLVEAGADIELNNPDGPLRMPMSYKLEATFLAILEKAIETIPSLAKVAPAELLRCANNDSIFDIFSRHQRAEAIKNEISAAFGEFSDVNLPPHADTLQRAGTARDAL